MDAACSSLDSRAAMAPRIALVHDFLLDLRGAERVFAAICDAWPEADVFTAVYDERGTEGRFADRTPRTSFLQRLQADRAHLPPAAALLSARGRVARPARLRHRHLVLERVGARRARRSRRRSTSATATTRSATPGPSARRRSRRATRSPARRCACCSRAGASGTGSPPSGSTATSPTRALTAARVRRYLGREATVLHPPVELEPLQRPRTGRRPLRRAGRADGAQAHRRRRARRSTRLGLPLVVIGDGPEGRRLRRLAGPTVRFTGRVERRATWPSCCATARALVVTAAEEFGIAAVEALASGRPVIALGAGGVRESVQRGRDRRVLRPRRRSRTRWPRSSPPSTPIAVDPAACVAAAERFGTGRFQAALRGDRGRGGAGRAGAAAAPATGVDQRGSYEDPLNCRATGHKLRNPVAPYGLSSVRERRRTPAT